MRKTAACLAIAFVSLCSLAQADNWGHWRGPNGNGAAVNASPPTEWSSSKNVKWKAELPGRENSSPVVWENQVFITTAVPQAGSQSKAGLPRFEFEVLCYDRNTGKLLWQQTATVTEPHQGTHATNGFASASPCTDGEHVYAHFGSRPLLLHDER